MSDTLSPHAPAALKKTPLYDEHVALKARMVEFGGWLMPVQYAGLIAEHNAVRNAVGLFDVSHMGEVIVKGPGALAAVNRLICNDLSLMKVGQCMYSPLMTPEGTLVDDLILYKYADDHIFICVNAANTDKDYNWIKARIAEGPGGDKLTVQNHSAHYGQIAVQGPLAQQVIQRLTTTDLSTIAYYHFAEGAVAGIPAIISHTGYTGAGGFELYVPAERTAELWRTLLKEGQPEGVVPAGLGCRDTLRLEVKFPLYGHELTEATTPLEAGLGWTVKLDNHDFIGKDVLVKQKAEGVTRKLVGVEVTGRGIPREGYRITTAHGEGWVTSGTMSPTLGKAIALAYVPTAAAKIGTPLSVIIREKPVDAVVCKTPFVAK